MWSAECYGYREAAHDAGIRVTILQLAVLTFLACASGAHAGEQVYSPVNRPFVYVGWQDPAFLPRRFRNHCSFEANQRALLARARTCRKSLRDARKVLLEQWPCHRGLISNRQVEIV